MKPILEIQNISKKFRIGGDRSGYKTLRDSLFSGRGKKEDKGEFWALQDVSFDVFPGDSIGIIGKNGAGKSTLLKILSRITPPTKGKIICRGRVASLLEVGTGFHGELSGRENIYLNGSILGLKRTEINSKFDEIVDFSGVEKFLDTPLKHYSSGMQLRLAFAVAAHLEPEILIIDEVLAVGDAEFQKKCLGKMDEISKQQGRTILFVSHNMGAVKQLCERGILLHSGLLIINSKMDDVINEYTNSKSNSNINLVRQDNLINNVLLKDNNNLNTSNFKFNEEIKIEIKISEDFHSFSKDTYIGIVCSNNIGRVFYTETRIEPKLNKYICKIPPNVLMEGQYYLNVVLHEPNKKIFDSTDNSLSFNIVNRPDSFLKYDVRHLGCFLPTCNWDIL